MSQTQPWPAPAPLDITQVVEEIGDADQGPTRRRLPRRRTLVVAAVVVVLLAGIATLGGLLIQTRGVLDNVKHNLAFTRVQLSTAQGELTATKNELNQATVELGDARRQVASVQQELAGAQTDLESARTTTRRNKDIADQLDTCLVSVMEGTLDVFTWNESRNQQCLKAIAAYKALALSGNDASI